MASSDAQQATNERKTDPIAPIDSIKGKSFDYVICGGGTAGLVLAAGLTEDPDISVAVLEAGKYRQGDPLVDTPAAFTQLIGNPEYDWISSSVPQAGCGDVRYHVPHGKLLGGSSGINYMVYVRGSDADYDDWGELSGDAQWSSKPMKEYMRKHQTLELVDSKETAEFASAYVDTNHGTTGPVKTGFNSTQLPIEASLIRALDETAGYAKKPLDPWGGDHLGFFSTLGAVVRTGADKGKRSYAARAYFEPNAHRPNLHVLCEAHVQKVIVDGEGKRATGVEFVHGGTRHQVTANREVLVCEGALHSPQLLELSGIGNPKFIEAAGIKPLIPSPDVGEHFQEHVLSCIAFALQPGTETKDSLFDPEVMAKAQKQLMEQQSGPLTDIPGSQGFLSYKALVSPEELARTVQLIKDTQPRDAFHKKQLDQVIAHLQDDNSASIQLAIMPVKANFDKSALTDATKLYSGLKEGEPPEITVGVILSYPASRGSIHITSSDPQASPAIDPAYLSHPADVAVMAAGLRFVNKAFASKHLSSQVLKRTYPRPEVDMEDLRSLEDVVRRFTFGVYHPISTCAMGSVVDARLRVKGIDGLRVVDASVFPNNLSGNISSSVYATAEKAADLIKQDQRSGRA